jgi:hypothetical protein
MPRIWCLGLALTVIFPSVYAQVDTSKPESRKMIIDERKGLNCGGIYQQTRLKIDAQLKVATKLEASVGLSPQTLANLNETATALGQKRREFCELYKVTPELNKDDYFRVYGELDKKESDLDLIFRSVAGKNTSDSLKSLQTVPPRETNAPADANAALADLRQGLSQMDLRVSNVETKIGKLAEEVDPVRQTIAAATATAEVTIASADSIDTHFADSGGYVAFFKGQNPLMVAISRDCFAIQQGGNRVLYRGVFTLDATSSIMGKPISALKESEYLQIGFKPMPPKQRVLGGRAIVTVNNTVRLEFEVPAQEMTADFVIVRNVGSVLNTIK